MKNFEAIIAVNKGRDEEGETIWDYIGKDGDNFRTLKDWIKRTAPKFPGAENARITRTLDGEEVLNENL